MEDLKGKIPSRRLLCGPEDDIKVDLKRIGFKSMDKIGLIQNRGRSSTLLITVLFGGFIKVE